MTAKFKATDPVSLNNIVDNNICKLFAKFEHIATFCVKNKIKGGPMWLLNETDEESCRRYWQNKNYLCNLF